MKKLLHKITHWEAWPFNLLYSPIALCWLWYIIRSRSVWFFTPSNPKITFGGLEGEPKKEMYELLPKELYPPTFNVLPGEELSSIQQKLSENGIVYPFIVKPEVGGQGILLRKIGNEAELQHYHATMQWEYIVQQLSLYPLEVSVFYIRHPLAPSGTVTGFLQKIPMYVIGDGVQSLQMLIQQHPKAQKRMEELSTKHRDNWLKVIPKGERYMLSYAANHNRGAQFVDLKDHIDDNLVKEFDRISFLVNDFFYGRYDIMCNSIEELKLGKNYTILEYNGCGAEPNHFYDTGYTLIGAYREILKHWEALYTISKYNSQQGIKPWPFLKGKKFLSASRKLMKDMKALDAKMGL